jgi:hypothetical protein
MKCNIQHSIRREDLAKLSSFIVETHNCLLQLQGSGGAVVVMTAGSHFSHSTEQKETYGYQLLWKELGT